MVKIALSGLSGCGNTTASRLLASRLRIPAINYTFRDLSKELGASVEELHALAVSEFPKYDLMLDKKQFQLASRQSSCVIGSRLAIWFDSRKITEKLGGVKPLKFDAKIWLDASIETRAARIAQREKKPLALALQETIERDSANQKRYKKLYGINILQLPRDAIVVNNEKRSPEETIEFIEKKLVEKGLWKKD